MRVAALLRREVAGFIERRVKNPGVGFVTVTGVKLSNDLKHARIFVVCRGDDGQRERTLRILRGCVRDLRRELNDVLRLRQVPAIRFEPDKSYDDADRVLDLLDGIRREEGED
jgi:ribosome-binding factor A